MNIAEQMDLALAPLWIVDPVDLRGIDQISPGQVISVRRIDSVRIIGGTLPVWEQARRVIEGADA
jgi:hypothetical protein